MPLSCYSILKRCATVPLIIFTQESTWPLDIVEKPAVFYIAWGTTQAEHSISPLLLGFRMKTNASPSRSESGFFCYGANPVFPPTTLT